MKSISKLLLLGGTVFCVQSVQAIDCTGLSEWSSQAAYTSGTQVQYSNKGYEANWWTQNKQPDQNSGQWQEWTLLGDCDGDGGDDNRAPVVNVNGPYSGVAGSAISLSSAGSSDSDGNIASYAWDFGDGESSTQANPMHTYSRAGSYTVSLTVTDNDGASSSASTGAQISDDDNGGNCDAPQYFAGTAYSAGDVVSNDGRKYQCDIAGWCSSSAAWAYEPGKGAHWQSAWTDTGACDGGDPTNQAPTANANGPYAAEINQAIDFSSRGSSDPDGTIAAYAWDFGDGSQSTEESPSHAYARAGSYNVTLTVTDDKGATNSASTTATVTDGGTGNVPPTADANGPYTVALGSAINFSSAGSSDSDGTIAGYAWNFGDGQNSTQANPSHTYRNAGRYNVSLTVTDDEGASHTSSTTATVNGDTGPGGDKLIGYFAQWGVYARNYHIKNIHTSGSAERLTHIMYAFGNVTNGECVIGDAYADYDKAYTADQSVDGVADTWDPGALRGNFGQLRRLKQMYPHIKVVWSFGGWTWSGGFGQAAQNPTKFANSCYDLVFDERWADVFDGIDIDWEYPNECGLTCDTSGFDGYPKLMKALRDRFGDKLVTSAIGAGEAKLNAANYGSAAQYLDFYMLMTYDFFGAWEAKGPTAPHSALHSYDGIPIEGFNTDHGLQVLRSKGVPADKILLGIGFYGRGWTGVSQAAPGGTATGPGPGTYEQGIEDYKVLKNTCPSNGTIAGTAYAHCGNNWWSYDTPATIQSKMNYSKQQGLGGAFFWELSGDTNNGELIKAMEDGLK